MVVKDLNSIKGIELGTIIEVELNNGEKMIGEYSYHPMAEECILNKNGFPISFKKYLRTIN